MNKPTHKMLLFLLLLFGAAHTRAQSSCGTAATVTYPFTQSVSGYSSDYYWLKVTLDTGAYQFSLMNGSGAAVNYANTYSGSCSGLSLLQSDTLLSGNSTFYISFYNSTPSNTYYFQLHRNAGTSSTFTVNGTPVLYVGGDLGYCAGKSVVLQAIPIGMSGAVTYTWQPGNAHTPTISVTPTATAVYTLSCTNGGSVYTATNSVFALPAAMCNSCEMVKNGALEGYQYRHNSLANISVSSTVCGQYTGTSDPLAWNGPSCGTADYFNSDFAGTSVSVPSNYCSVNAPAHSGHAYLGVLISDANGIWREYAQAPLRCALVNGQAYNVSFYTMPGTRQYAGTANNIGAYLSATAISSTGLSTLGSYVPQINASAPITSTVSWTQVAGQLTGNGEQYITLGNFYDHAHTTGIGYYFIDDISVTPATPTLSATNCQGGYITLSETGSPGAYIHWYGPSSYTATGASVSIPSSAPGTYTCTLDLSASCPSCAPITQTISVNTYACGTGTPPASYTPSAGSYTFSPAIGYINGNLQLNSGVNYVISGVDLRINPSYSITVNNGGTLTITNSWLHACNPCGGAMWPGIVVNSGGKLIVTNSILEDAQKAVYTAYSGSATPIPSYTITGSLFNQNTCGIYIDAHPGDLSTNQVYNTVFSCRNLTTHSTAFIGILKGLISAATPLHPDAYDPKGLTLAGARSQYGVYLASLKSGTATKIGNSAQSNNLFDNLDYGIYASHSSLTAQNNVFSNLTADASATKGIGIYSNGQTGYCWTPCDGPPTLIVGNSSTTPNNAERNTFTNCLIGVSTEAMRKLYVNNNIFNNETTAATFTTGSCGLYGTANNDFANASLSGNGAEVFQFANNNVQNSFVGLWHLLGSPTNTVASSQYITTNTLTATGSNYMTAGIYLAQSTAQAAGTGVPQNAIDITANTISNVNTNAICVNSVNSSTVGGFVSIHENTELSVKYNSAATQTMNIAAVYVSNSKYTAVQKNSVVRTTGTTNYGTGAGGSCAKEISGIYLYQSPHSQVTCNNVTYVGQCFVADGNCNGTFWQQNTFDLGRFGLVLRNHGYMGNQGSVNNAVHTGFGNSDATGHGFSDYQTYTESGSNPYWNGLTPSALYVLSNACPNSGGGAMQDLPCYNGNDGTSGIVSYTTGVTNQSLITTGMFLNIDLCSDGGRMAAGNNTVSDNDTDSLYQSLLQLIQPGASLGVYDYEVRWGNQYYVNSVSDTIHAAEGYENARSFAMADGQLAAGNYAQAQNIVGGINASTLIENNWKTVDNLLIKLQSDTLSAADISALKGVAVQCPVTGGSIVWKARALLDAELNTHTNYDNSCSAEYNSRMAGINKPANAKVANIRLYPNPNNGSMSIEYTIKNNARLEITDLNGNLVYTCNLSAAENKLEIKNGMFESGIYLYRVINGDVTKTGKIVIIK